MSFDPMTIKMQVEELDQIIPMTLRGETTIIPGDTALWRRLLTRSMLTLDDDMIPVGITELPDYIFQLNEELTDVSLSKIISVGEYTFFGCGITDLYLPNLQTALDFAFSRNPFESVTLPKLKSVSQFLFAECPNLRRVDFSDLNEIHTRAFYDCENLSAIILRMDEMLPFPGNSPFSGTKIEDGSGYFYVKENLLNDYLNDSGWEYYSEIIRTIEDYSL